ncbi:alpha/beta hydrolase-fold protein [Kitasatospora sp. NPDC001540]|uniref:alpha/beta hydrolase-fold protein n=1 Tax=Kitasatospora sp. NPDC001540 TaxID=3364014 RepID=UPI0036B46E0E
MPRSLLVLSLLVAVVAGSWLARSAMVRWRDLRAAQTYELAAEVRPVLVRAFAAALCLTCVSALGVAVLVGERGGRGAVRAVAAEAGSADRVAPPPVSSPSAPSAPAPSAAVAPSASAVAFASVGRAAGGELMQGSVPGPNGRSRTVRVWLPAEYGKSPAERFPVIVLHSGTPGRTADADLPDVFDGVASAVQQGKARPFVVVAPEAPGGTGHPCDLVAAAPQAVADDAALRSAVGAAFRTLPPGPAGWSVLGVDGGAPCAAAAGLARPDLYGAAAAVSGRYDARALAGAAAEAPGAVTARLLLAAAKRDTDGLASGRAVQAALQGAKSRAQVRTSEVVQDYTPERERLRLVRVAVQYLAEGLAK